MLISPLFDFALTHVADAEAGCASGVRNSLQPLTGALGVAVIGTHFFTPSSTLASWPPSPTARSSNSPPPRPAPAQPAAPHHARTDEPASSTRSTHRRIAPIGTAAWPRRETKTASMDAYRPDWGRDLGEPSSAHAQRCPDAAHPGNWANAGRSAARLVVGANLPPRRLPHRALPRPPSKEAH